MLGGPDDGHIYKFYISKYILYIFLMFGRCWVDPMMDSPPCDPADPPAEGDTGLLDLPEVFLPYFNNVIEISKHLKGRSGPRVSRVFDSHIAGWRYGRSGPQVRHVFDSHIAGWL